MILTTINGMPLYSNTREAVAHAFRIGLKGYHTHTFRGRVGYMAGVSHNSIINNSSNTQTTPAPIPTIQVTNPTISRTSGSTSGSSSSSGGGGGGGGY